MLFCWLFKIKVNCEKRGLCSNVNFRFGIVVHDIVLGSPHLALMKGPLWLISGGFTQSKHDRIVALYYDVIVTHTDCILLTPLPQAAFILKVSSESKHDRIL